MEDTTDEKLTKLKSYFPEVSNETLLELLVSCSGDTSRVLDLLEVNKEETCKGNLCARSQSKRVNYQTTLKRFVVDSECDDHEHKQKGKIPRMLDSTIKGRTYHLYDPDMVNRHLPCTFHLDVFPKELADRLLTVLLKDSKEWTSRSFYMFERLVKSHHSTALYSDRNEFTTKDATYNGLPAAKIRPFNDGLKQARDIIQDIVNEEIIKRGLAKYQYSGEWVSDIAVCNGYNGSEETVGYHSDQMTHLGPHCVIASVSLGTTREFRLKDRHDRDTSTFSIHVPHNSMVIMHAGCQEEYKHSLVPSACPITPHPISGDVRINITFRMYLDDFKTNKLPHCDCGFPMLLRTNISKERNYRHIWQCSASYNDGKGCSKIIWPKFKENACSNDADR